MTTDDSFAPIPAVDSGDRLMDMTLHLQQLLLSTDTVFQSTTKGNSASSDDYIEQLAPIIKEAIVSNASENLRDLLDNITRLKDREIDSICSGDHNEYMASVQQLGQVSTEAEHIRSSVLDIGQRLQGTGESLALKKTSLLECQKTRINVDTAIEAVTACLRVLDLTNNIHEMIRSKQKFAALKSLDDLQKVHLKEVSDYGFAQLINKSVPALMKMVRDETIADIESWLLDIRQKSELIGKQAFDVTEHQRMLWKKQVAESPYLKKYKYNSPVELAYRESSTDYLNSDNVNTDFSPLYECVLVHTSMGLFNEFHHYFESDRKIQRDYLIPQSLSFTNLETGEDDLTQIKAVLHNITGFCIVDRMISRKIPDLRSSKEVDDIWESLSQKLGAILSKEVNRVTNLDSIRQTKQLIGTFLHTMEDFGFDTLSIQAILLMLFKRYSAYLRETFDKNFYKTMQEDDYMPMVISDPAMYKRIAEVTWYTPDPSETNKKFPKTLPFSQIFPLCCAEIKTFMNYHYSFLDNLQHDLSQIEDILRTALDDLLLQTICKTFENRLKSTTREQIVQILINLEYFQQASEQVEKILASERMTGRTGKVTLEATEAFARARKKAEERIFELVNSVVDDFLDLADYNFTTTSKTNNPSGFLTDMVSFLKTLVNSALVNLPRSIKSFVYFDAFDHLSSSLLKMLIDADELTVEAVENFAVDVYYLKQFMNEIGKSANDMSITTTVIELQQCVDLLLSDNIAEYNNTLVRMKKYDRVKPEIAKRLNDKLLRPELSSSDDTESNPQRHSSSSSHTTPSSKFMKYYRTSVDKLNDRIDRTER